jgi:hypothetical protein
MILPKGLAQDNGPDRSFTTAIQNINGLNSILTLLPVLTGKVQNVRLVASRIYAASFVIVGVGAGRVLSKLQLGILLCSFDLYRNTITELSYPHDEFVNKYAPVAQHVPSATPERHASGLIVNHNPAENYMVEAWFRTQGLPSIVELQRKNYLRMTVGYLLYLVIYSTESFLGVENAATGTAHVFLFIQVVCVVTWLAGVTIVQVKRRGNTKRKIELNTTNDTKFRCLTIPTHGNNVSSAVFSFHHDNLQEYRLFDSNYEQPMVGFAGILILVSAALDIMSTILIVGLTTWAYPWIALEMLILVVKIVFCLEPMREAEILKVEVQSGYERTDATDGEIQLPIVVNTVPSLICRKVCTRYNIFEDRDSGIEWRSTTPGLWIGQGYDSDGEDGKRGTLYLSTEFTELGSQNLSLVATKPPTQDNQALQREFLAAIKNVVEGNKVPSKEFVAAVEQTIAGMKSTMTPEWHTFGAKELREELGKVKGALRWRRFC